MYTLCVNGIPFIFKETLFYDFVRTLYSYIFLIEIMTLQSWVDKDFIIIIIIINWCHRSCGILKNLHCSNAISV